MVTATKWMRARSAPGSCRQSEREDEPELLVSTCPSTSTNQKAMCKGKHLHWVGKFRACGPAIIVWVWQTAVKAADLIMASGHDVFGSEHAFCFGGDPGMSA
eukprot:14087707-Alexandrium_andersonii.AAC.1